MSEQFIGCSVSIEVGGGLGFYQGIIKNVHTHSQLITLKKVLHNGKPTNKPEVAINAADILNLKILNEIESRWEEKFQNVKNDKTKKEIYSKKITQNQNCDDGQSTKKSNDITRTFKIKVEKEADPISTLSSNCKDFSADSLPNKIETLSMEESNFSSGSTHFKRRLRTVGEILAGGSHPNEFRSSGKKNCFNTANSLTHEYGYQRKNAEGQQGKRQWSKQWQTLRDESTFGTPIDKNLLNTDFDFEKNLALFDKQAVIEEIQNLKPDVVRQADKKINKKYRCDENILDAKPEPKQQIMVPASEAGEIIYTTDSGLLVPSVSTELRLNLLSTANQFGLTKSRQLEMIGRGATEIIISVIGGSHSP